MRQIYNFLSWKWNSKKNSVAIIIPKQIRAYVMGYNSISDRIIFIKIQGSCLIYILHRGTYDNGWWRSNWILWKLQVVDQTPKKDVLIIIGNFNANIGEEKMVLHPGVSKHTTP